MKHLLLFFNVWGYWKKKTKYMLCKIRSCIISYLGYRNPKSNNLVKSYTKCNQNVLILCYLFLYTTVNLNGEPNEQKRNRYKERKQRQVLYFVNILVFVYKYNLPPLPETSLSLSRVSSFFEDTSHLSKCVWKRPSLVVCPYGHGSYSQVPVWPLRL